MFRTSEKNMGIGKNMSREEEELQRWLSGGLLHPSYVRGSLQLQECSSSSSTKGFCFSYGGSSCSAPSEDVKNQISNFQNPNTLWFDPWSTESLVGEKNLGHECGDVLGLSETFHNMVLLDEQRTSSAKIKRYEMDTDRFGFGNFTFGATNPSDIDKTSQYQGSCSNDSGFEDTLPSLMRAYPPHAQSYSSHSSSSLERDQIHYLLQQKNEKGSCSYSGGVHTKNPCIISSHDTFLNSQSSSVDDNGGRGIGYPLSFPGMLQSLKSQLPGSSMAKERERGNTLPQSSRSTSNAGEPLAYRCDNSFIIQGKDLRYEMDKSYSCSRDGKKKVPDKVATKTESGKKSKQGSALSPLFPTIYSLAELQSYMYLIVKDQLGCRLIQRIFDEGTSDDIQIIFEGIIEHVIELMMDPFGNYLVQKLLDACSEEQRMQIVYMVTKQQQQFVMISLNPHGTRVVQKLIQTVKTRKQIALLKSALKPAFLDLAKDPNGNHVIERCLKYLSYEDTVFILKAATKYCVQVATHRNGCCALQRCIDYASGKYGDKLVAEICRNALSLAQDPFGNYVVQHIIERRIPAAATKLISLFKGNFVNLSIQKCSSHVVEKCLKHFQECRPIIIHELLSVSHFEQLLQDPYANYVIQSALAVTKGPLHASLVEAIRARNILHTNPYCKRIFSRNLLKK